MRDAVRHSHRKASRRSRAALSRGTLLLLACIVSREACSAGSKLTDNWSVFVSESTIYDENLYRLPSDYAFLSELAGPDARRTDLINQVTAGASGEWHFSHQDFTVQASIDDNRYHHNSFLNNVSGAASAEWKWMFGHRLTGDIGADFSRSQASFANNRYLAKDLLDTQGYFGNFAYRTGTYWSITASAQSSVTTHSAYPRGIDDSHYDSGGVGLEYKSRAGNVLGWDYRFARGKYNQDLDFNGIQVNPNFRQNDLGMRLSYGLSGKTALQASAGYLKQTYPDQLPGTFSPDFSGVTWRAAITHSPTTKVAFTLTGYRQLTAYLDAESNYFVAQGASISSTWSINRKLSAKADYGWAHQDYIGSSPLLFGLDNRKDTVSSWNVSASYLLFVKGTLSAAFHHEGRSSNTDGLAYTDSVMSMSFKFSL